MKKIGIREARGRLAELIEQAGGGEPITLTRRGPGRTEAVLLPVEAAAVWQRHLAEQEAEKNQRAGEGPGRAAAGQQTVDLSGQRISLFPGRPGWRRGRR